MPVFLSKDDPRKRVVHTNLLARPPGLNDDNYPPLQYGPHLPVDLAGYKAAEAKREAEQQKMLRDEELSWVWVDREDAKWVGVYKKRVHDTDVEEEQHYALPFLSINLQDIFKSNENLTQPEPKGIFKLPQEIREIIWEMAAPNVCPCYEYECNEEICQLDIVLRSEHWEGSRPDWPKFLPTTCFISRWLLLEMIHVFIHTKKFSICTIEEEKFFRGFLNAVPAGYEQVRSLRLRYFDIYENGAGDLVDKHGGSLPNENAIDLAIRCTGLKVLHISFLRTGPKWPGDDPPLRELPATEIAQRFRLDRLAKCHSLHAIEVTVAVRYWGYRKKVEQVMNWLYTNMNQGEASKVRLTGWPEFWAPYENNRAYYIDYVQDWE